jgi:RimJ/RimL family protein N-acetyltransferase
LLSVVTNKNFGPVFRDWLGERLNCKFDDTTRFIASMSEENGMVEILAVCAFNNWTPDAVEARFATNGGKRKKFDYQFIYTCFDYAFHTRNCIVTHCAVDNEKSIAIHEQVGFNLIALIPGYCGEGKDAYLFSITKAEWLRGPWSHPTAPVGAKE